MNFRKVPFQFQTDDPTSRHSELMKRFGVTSNGEMLVESPNSNLVDSGFVSSSPRLQHRLPDLFSGEQRSAMKENHAGNVDGRTEPRVRVIPIEIEKGPGLGGISRHHTRSGDSSCRDDNMERRQRSNSGSSGFHNIGQKSPVSHQSASASSRAKPRVCNIPVVIEGRDSASKPKKQPGSINIPVQREVSSNAGSRKPNGPCVSKPSKERVVKVVRGDAEKEKIEPAISNSLKLIENILKEFKSYQQGVEQFSGVQGDKQYRYLDEMLTRCMLKLDDVQTHGDEEVRKARKTAITQVQNCINILESKIQAKKSSVNKVPSGDVYSKEEERIEADDKMNVISEGNTVEKIMEDEVAEPKSDTLNNEMEVEKTENKVPSEAISQEPEHKARSESLNNKKVETEHEAQPQMLNLEEEVEKMEVSVTSELPVNVVDNKESKESIGEVAASDNMKLEANEHVTEKGSTVEETVSKVEETLDVDRADCLMEVEVNADTDEPAMKSSQDVNCQQLSLSNKNPESSGKESVEIDHDRNMTIDDGCCEAKTRSEVRVSVVPNDQITEVTVL